LKAGGIPAFPAITPPYRRDERSWVPDAASSPRCRREAVYQLGDNPRQSRNLWARCGTWLAVLLAGRRLPGVERRRAHRYGHLLQVWQLFPWLADGQGSDGECIIRRLAEHSKAGPSRQVGVSKRRGNPSVGGKVACGGDYPVAFHCQSTGAGGVSQQFPYQVRKRLAGLGALLFQTANWVSVHRN
jgi:hypothetical protein